MTLSQDRSQQQQIRIEDDRTGLSVATIKRAIAQRQSAWREVIATANQLGIAIPAFSSSLNYFDTYRREILPQNLTQAQRDYFGAHTYERVDKTRGEFFHTEWRCLRLASQSP